MEFRYLFIELTIFFLLSEYHCYDIRGIGQLIEKSTQDRKRKYCGKHLTETLSALCKGNYQTIRPFRIRKKRDTRTTILSSLSLTSLQLNPPLNMRSRSMFILDASTRKRRKRGVYDECCEKPCTQVQLSMYCADSASN